MSLAISGLLLYALCVCGVVADMFFDFSLFVRRWIVVTGVLGLVFILINFFLILSV